MLVLMSPFLVQLAIYSLGILSNLAVVDGAQAQAIAEGAVDAVVKTVNVTMHHSPELASTGLVILSDLASNSRNVTSLMHMRSCTDTLLLILKATRDWNRKVVHHLVSVVSIPAPLEDSSR